MAYLRPETLESLEKEAKSVANRRSRNKQTRSRKTTTAAREADRGDSVKDVRAVLGRLIGLSQSACLDATLEALGLLQFELTDDEQNVIAGRPSATDCVTQTWIKDSRFRDRIRGKERRHGTLTDAKAREIERKRIGRKSI